MTDDMKQAIAAVMGDKILEAMAGPQRDALLGEAVRKYLTGYDINTTVRDLIQERGREIAKRVLDEGTFDAVIESEIRKGLTDYIGALAPAVRKAIETAIHGRKLDSGYGSGHPGIVLDLFAKS